MSDLNMVQIIGRLGDEPTMRYTASGSAIANLSVATSDKWRDKQSGEMQESTEWHRIVFFGRQAEICGEYLHKGGLVYIRGSLQTRKWEDKEGVTRYTTEIKGREMSMLGSRQDSQQPPAQQEGFREPPAQQEAASPQDNIPF